MMSNGPDPKKKKLTNEDEQDTPLNVEKDVEEVDQEIKPDPRPTVDENNVVEKNDTLDSDFPEDKQDEIEK